LAFFLIPLLLINVSAVASSDLCHWLDPKQFKQKKRKTMKPKLIPLALACALAFHGTAFAKSTHFDTLANLPFKENRPTKETAQTLRDELLFLRATQTYL
jgi:hypothetical protein